LSIRQTRNSINASAAPEWSDFHASVFEGERMQRYTPRKSPHEFYWCARVTARRIDGRIHS
jgi:hypothetical protein